MLRRKEEQDKADENYDKLSPAKSSLQSLWVQDCREETKQKVERIVAKIICWREVVLQPCSFNEEKWHKTSRHQYDKHQRSSSFWQRQKWDFVKTWSFKLSIEAGISYKNDLKWKGNCFSNKEQVPESWVVAIQKRFVMHSS